MPNVEADIKVVLTNISDILLSSAVSASWRPDDQGVQNVGESNESPFLFSIRNA
jgi:hypothetical protein